MLNDGDKGVIIQRDKETYAVAPHIPCGVVTPAMLRKIADVAEKYNAAALKITGAARIAIVGLKEQDIDNVWKDLGMDAGAAIGMCIRSVKVCPGTTFCKRGMQDSLSVGMAMDKKYHGLQVPGKMKLGVSGCPNQCAESQLRDIGLVGTVKGWRLYVGGNGGNKPRIGRLLAENLTGEQALALIDKVIDYFIKNSPANRRLGSVLEKIDFENFRKEITS